MSSEYLGFLRKGDVVEEKKKTNPARLEELKMKIQEGSTLTNSEMDECSVSMLEAYLRMRGHKIY